MIHSETDVSHVVKVNSITSHFALKAGSKKKGGSMTALTTNLDFR